MRGLGSVMFGCCFDGSWAGWEETETALRQDGWDAETEHARVLRVLPASSLVATIASESVTWTDEESPVRFTASAFRLAADERVEPLFEFYVEGHTTFAIFIAAAREVERFRPLVAEITRHQGVSVSLEDCD